MTQPVKIRTLCVQVNTEEMTEFQPQRKKRKLRKVKEVAQNVMPLRVDVTLYGIP